MRDLIKRKEKKVILKVWSRIETVISKNLVECK